MQRENIVVITTALLHSTTPELRFRLTFAMVKISVNDGIRVMSICCCKCSFGTRVMYKRVSVSFASFYFRKSNCPEYFKTLACCNSAKIG